MHFPTRHHIVHTAEKARDRKRYIYSKVFGVAVKTPPNPPSRDRDQVACVVGHVSRYCISQTCLGNWVI